MDQEGAGLFLDPLTEKPAEKKLSAFGGILKRSICISEHF